MCGRFTQAYTWRELYELYRLTCPPVNTEPRYNIAPTTTIDVGGPHEAGRDLLSMRWGLIPSWWKKRRRRCRQLSTLAPRRSPLSRCFALPSSVVAASFRPADILNGSRHRVENSLKISGLYFRF